MPSCEQAYTTWYSFTPPQVKAERTVVRLFIVHAGKRIPLEQEELAGPLHDMGVPIERETSMEPSARTCEAFSAEIEAFHAGLPVELAGSVILLPRGYAMVETPSVLGVGEHRRRRALIERFLRDRGLEFTTECRVTLSENACQPLPAGLVARVGAALA